MVRANREHQHQVAFKNWCIRHEKKYPELELIYAIPNGEHRKISVAKRLKDEGVRPGVPDIHLPVSMMDHHSLYIEFKAPGGRLSKAQAAFLPKLAAEANLVVMAYDWEAARDAVVSYLSGSPPTFKKKWLERVGTSD